MATDLKRFTISITPVMEAELDLAKRERYYRETRNDMIRDLINRGLSTLKEEPGSIHADRGLSVTMQRRGI